MRLFFRKNQRVVRRRDFTTVLAHKCFVRNSLMRLYAAPNGLEFPRLGVSIGRRCGCAVYRNSLKRLAREVFRLHQHDLPSGRDYVLILTAVEPIKKRSKVSAMKYQTFEVGFLDLVRSLSQKPCFEK